MFPVPFINSEKKVLLLMLAFFFFFHVEFNDGALPVRSSLSFQTIVGIYFYRDLNKGLGEIQYVLSHTFTPPPHTQGLTLNDVVS
jgi:hypothetical protein